jgi:cell wall-associated NlpC family hydrolase
MKKQNMTERMVSIVLSVFFFLPLALTQETRTFTNADGTKTFEGVLIDFDEGKELVKVSRVGSGAITFALSVLSKEDQSYVREQGKVLAAKKALPSRLRWKPDSKKHPHSAHEECPVDFDFEYRDTLPQSASPLPPGEWAKQGWGPPATTYPELKVPECVKDPIEWKRRRVVAAARKYIGLPYMHKHVPAAGGLDCSNYTAWVYNYAFGIRFSSAVGAQAEEAGRRLDPEEELLPGDLMFQTTTEGDRISHAVIYIGEIPDRGGRYLIDSTKGSVEIREIRYWYVDRHSHSRRIIE